MHPGRIAKQQERRAAPQTNGHSRPSDLQLAVLPIDLDRDGGQT